MDFSMLFLKKHCRKIYNPICDKIKEESPSKYNKRYVSIFFKIAFLNYFGIEHYHIEKLIKDVEKIDNVNVAKLKVKHRNSIYEIEKYLIETNNKSEK